MRDDMLERELHAWFEAHAEPEVPASLRTFLSGLPRIQEHTYRVGRSSPIVRLSPRRDLATVLLAAGITVALGVGLIAGGFFTFNKPSDSPASSSGIASPDASARASGPYHWTVVSSTGEAAGYGVRPAVRRPDGSLLAIGFGQDARVLLSPDGRSWTVEPTDPGLVAAEPNHISLITGLAEQGDQLVAVGATALDDISSGDARAWTSTDGLTWQAVPTTPGMIDAEMESVAAGPSGFVAVGSDGFPGGNTQLPGARGAAVWLSPDGRTWERVPEQASFQGAVMFGVLRTPSGYVAWGEIHDTGGSSPPAPPIWTSSDGQQWERAKGIGDAGGPGAPIASIVAIGDRLVAVGARQLPESEDSVVVPAAWQSEDGGRTWTLAGSPELGSAPRAGGLRDVAVSGSELLAVGHLEGAPGASGGYSAIAWRSTDQGATWVALPDEPSFAGSLMERAVGIDAGFVVFGAADGQTALANPKLIWLAERPAAPIPTIAPPTETLSYAGFVNASVGWAVTNRRLVLTDDGGATWRTAGPPVDYAGGAPKGASFFDAAHGWVVSEDAFSSSLSLWRTTDAGATWARTILPAVPDPAEAMGDARTFWIDATHAVIDVAGGMPNGFQDGLLFTADAGATWSEPAMRSATAGADGITGDPSFLDPKIGWLAGGAPGTRLWATRDGGDTWKLQQLSAPAGYLDDQGSFWGAPTFFDPSNGVVARTFDNNQSTVLVIYRTGAGGRTWQPVSGVTPEAVSSWSFPTPTAWNLWDPYHARMWRSTDQGSSWTGAVPVGLPSNAAPVMTDEQHGWTLSAGNPGLLVTSDGGLTWAGADPLSAPPAQPQGTLGPPPSAPPTRLTLTGAFGATIDGGVDPGICATSSFQGILEISPEPGQVAESQFVRVGIWVPAGPGIYPADALLGPDGSASVQAAILTNPAGGGGDPPWLAVDGSITVTVANDLWNPARYGVVSGSIDALLRRAGQPDLRLSGQWGCVHLP